MIVKIIDTIYGGYGIAKDENGKIIFIPHSVENDILDITIIKENKKFSYASINKIIEKSDYRIDPKCKYAGICGGCVFNHINYNKQLDIKKNIIINSIRNINYKNDDIKIIFNSNNKGYRFRVNMIAINGRVGFYRFKTNDFVEVDECYVMKNSLLEKIKSFVIENNLTAGIYAIENNDNEALAFVKYTSKAKLKSINNYFKGIAIKHNKNFTSYGENSIIYKTRYGNIGIGYKTFFQNNLYLLDIFQTQSIKYFDKDDIIVVELYAGSGFFTAAIDSILKQLNNDYKLISSEINKYSVNVANKYNLKIRNEDAFITLKNIDYNIDVLFVDPPRDGLSKKVIEQIIRIKPKKIIYISCNPMTFSRDINLLKDYYKLFCLNIIDMFVDTYHIELISCIKLIK